MKSIATAPPFLSPPWPLMPYKYASFASSRTSVRTDRRYGTQHHFTDSLSLSKSSLLLMNGSARSPGICSRKTKRCVNSLRAGIGLAHLGKFDLSGQSPIHQDISFMIHFLLCDALRTKSEDCVQG